MGLVRHWSRESADKLLSDASSDQLGHVSPSIYETARLVTLAPWLAGHDQRVRFVLAGQREDGGWGGPDGYGLVPTLSATEALLTTLRRSHDRPVDHGKLVGAAAGGLRALFAWLGRGARLVVPDTIAVEIVVPALIGAINEHLELLAARPLTGLDPWRGSALPMPHGVDDELLSRLRGMARQGKALPPKLSHSLEAIGDVIRGASFVRLVQGAVGNSPAATAAWLEDRPSLRGPESVGYLEALVSRGNGPVPGVSPVTVFERAWVLRSLLGSGIPIRVPPHMIDELHAEFGELGVPAGRGLPPDSDDTAVALVALATAGSRRSADCLWAYHVDPYFSCFPAERTTSTSTNAHVLEALGTGMAGGLPHEQYEKYETAIGKLTEWLCETQEDDGSWWDKWHASPFYATVCCVEALAGHGGQRSASSVRAAVEWVLDNQRDDGSWGYWTGTQEETAYAIRTVLRANISGLEGRTVPAAAAGAAFLERLGDPDEHPPLWHDKDLYAPIRVLQAERLAALHLVNSDPRIAAAGIGTAGATAK